MKRCVCESSRNGKFFCRATTYKECKGTECAFYASKDDAGQAKRKTYEKIRTLPYHSQQFIADTYYDGEMPWKDF